MSGRRQFGSSKSRKLAEKAAASGATKRTPRRKRVKLQANPPSASKPPEIALPTIDPSSSKLVLIRLPAHVDIDQLESMRLDEPFTLNDRRRYVFQLDDRAIASASAMLGDGSAIPTDDNDEEEEEEVMDNRKRRNSKKTPSKQKVKQTKTTPITPTPFHRQVRLVVDETPRDLLQHSEEQFVTLRPAYPLCPQVGGLKRRWMPLGSTTVAPTAAVMLATTTVVKQDDSVAAAAEAKPAAQNKTKNQKKARPDAAKAAGSRSTQKAPPRNGLSDREPAGTSDVQQQPVDPTQNRRKAAPPETIPTKEDPSKTTAKRKRKNRSSTPVTEEATPQTKEDPSSTPSAATDLSKATSKKNESRSPAAAHQEKPQRTKEDPSSSPTAAVTATPPTSPAPNGTKRKKRKDPPTPTANGDNNHDDTMTVASSSVKVETNGEDGRKDRSSAKVKTEDEGERPSKRSKKESSSKKAKKEEKRKHRKKKKIKEEAA